MVMRMGCAERAGLGLMIVSLCCNPAAEFCERAAPECRRERMFRQNMRPS